VPRFGLLETVREYGLDLLEASGEANLVRQRHADYFFSLAEELERTPSVPEMDTRLRALDAEVPNLRLALEWTEAMRDPDRILRFAVSLWGFWDSRCAQTEACSWLDRAVAASANVPPGLYGLRATVLVYAAIGNKWRGQPDRAAALLDEGLRLARASGDGLVISMAVFAQGSLALWRDDLNLAETCYQDALARVQGLDKQDAIRRVLWQLGYVDSLRGDYDAAEARFAESLEIARAAGWRIPIAYALEAIGTCARERGEYQRSAALFGEALELLVDSDDPGLIRICLKSLGAIAAVAGQPERGARLFGVGEALWDIYIGGTEPAFERTRYDRAVAPANAQLTPDAFEAARSAGRTMPVEDAIADALAVARDVGGPSFVLPGGNEPASPPLKSTPPAGITPREIEVLRLLAAGRSDREIAAELFVSRNTAANHVAHILAKLGVPSRAAAAAFAVRHGLA
jgi:non-specific serine/threonine protein kinase